MNAKHTPGHWKVVEHSWSDSSIFASDDKQVARLSIYDVATESTQSALEKEMDANARLIAAAPDLLEALEAMTGKAGKQNWNDMYPAQYAAALSAIDKAKGKAP